MTDRYCTNCGHELAPENRFCTGCGRPVHATAQVSQQGANFATSSPNWQQPPEAPPSRGIRAPLLVLGGVFLVLGFAEFLQGMVNAPKHDVGFVLGYGVGGAIGSVLGWVILTLIAGGGVYLFYRFRRRDTTFVQALFSWPVVVIATCLALLSLVG
jgi:hypothetical protein